MGIFSIFRRKKPQEISPAAVLSTNGFHVKHEGRITFVYYVRDSMLIQMDVEMPAKLEDELPSQFDVIRSWTIPHGVRLDTYEKMMIKRELLQWLETKKF